MRLVDEPQVDGAGTTECHRNHAWLTVILHHPDVCVRGLRLLIASRSRHRYPRLRTLHESRLDTACVFFDEERENLSIPHQYPSERCQKA